MTPEICIKFSSIFIEYFIFQNLFSGNTLFSVFILIKLINSVANNGKNVIWIKERMFSIICLQLKKTWWKLGWAPTWLDLTWNFWQMTWLDLEFLKIDLSKTITDLPISVQNWTQLTWRIAGSAIVINTVTIWNSD